MLLEYQHPSNYKNFNLGFNLKKTKQLKNLDLYLFNLKPQRLFSDGRNLIQLIVVIIIILQSESESERKPKSGQIF